MPRAPAASLCALCYFLCASMALGLRVAPATPGAHATEVTHTEPGAAPARTAASTITTAAQSRARRLQYLASSSDLTRAMDVLHNRTDAVSPDVLACMEAADATPTAACARFMRSETQALTEFTARAHAHLQLLLTFCWDFALPEAAVTPNAVSETHTPQAAPPASQPTSQPTSPPRVPLSDAELVLATKAAVAQLHAELELTHEKPARPASAQTEAGNEAVQRVVSMALGADAGRLPETPEAVPALLRLPSVAWYLDAFDGAYAHVAEYVGSVTAHLPYLTQLTEAALSV